MPAPTLTPTSSRYYYDGAYHTTAGAPAPTPTPSFTPLRSVDFDGLIDGQSTVNGDTGDFTAASVSGKRFDEALGNKGFQGGYGTRASTDVKMTGRTSACRITIPTGSDGDPAGGGTGASYGAFGGTLNYGADQVSQGEEIWARVAIYIPSSFNFTTNISALKFLRMSQSESTSRIDTHIVNGDQNGLLPASVQAGWGALSEIDASIETFKDNDRKFVLDTWNTVEMYVKPNATLADSIRRLWVNGQLAYEQNGTAFKWFHGGIWNNQTMTQGRTLVTSAGELTNFMLFTYWNGNSPANNTCYVQAIEYHKNSADLTETDEFGNKMMGVYE